MSDRVWKWVYPLPYVIGHSNQLSQNKFFDMRTLSMRKCLDRGETEGGRGKLNYCSYFDKKKLVKKSCFLVRHLLICCTFLQDLYTFHGHLDVVFC